MPGWSREATRQQKVTLLVTPVRLVRMIMLRRYPASGGPQSGVIAAAGGGEPVPLLEVLRQAFAGPSSPAVVTDDLDGPGKARAAGLSPRYRRGRGCAPRAVLRRRLTSSLRHRHHAAPIPPPPQEVVLVDDSSERRAPGPPVTRARFCQTAGRGATTPAAGAESGTTAVQRQRIPPASESSWPERR